MTIGLIPLALALALAPPEAVTIDDSEPQDLVFFNESQPLFLRFHILVDGKPYQTYWAETVRKLHKYLDADGDGVLSAKERGWLQQLSAALQNNRGGNPRPAEPGRSTDGVQSADDLVAFLRPIFGPFQLQVTPRGESGPETLFSHLDRDGDRKLSAAELRDADATLRRYDEDDDETIRAEELMPYRNPFNAQQVRLGNMVNVRAATDNAPFAALGPGESRTKLARRLLTLYDKHGGPDDGPGKDNRLQRDESGLSPDAFASADNDGDGGLDADELVHALASIPPGLELLVRVGRGASGPTTIEVLAPDGKPSPLAAHVRKGSESELGLALENVLVEINAGPGGPMAALDVREFYIQQFRAADGDNNKYLDKKESERNGLFGRDRFALMDRDGDGKLFEEEVREFVGQQADAAESRTMLGVSDQGRSLFEVLDLNRDRRLSVRELRAAVRKVAAWDRDGDGAIGTEEVPRHFRLNFGRGQSPLLVSVNGFVVVASGGGESPGPAAGSDWFRKMDRNGDGDLSAREFLGTPDQFRKLDADGDGLIDPAEASKAR